MTCSLCQGIIPPLAILSKHILHLQLLVKNQDETHQAYIQHASQELESALSTQTQRFNLDTKHIQQRNMTLVEENEQLRNELQLSKTQLLNVRSDMETMGERLLDELEIRAEVK